MTLLRRVAANSGWWLAERAGALLLTLGTSVVVVRALGPAQYGELSYLLALTGLPRPRACIGARAAGRIRSSSVTSPRVGRSST